MVLGPCSYLIQIWPFLSADEIEGISNTPVWGPFRRNTFLHLQYQIVDSQGCLSILFFCAAVGGATEPSLWMISTSQKMSHSHLEGSLSFSVCLLFSFSHFLSFCLTLSFLSLSPSLSLISVFEKCHLIYWNTSTQWRRLYREGGCNWWGVGVQQETLNVPIRILKKHTLKASHSTPEALYVIHISV